MTLVTPRDLSWFTFAKSVAILAPKRLKVVLTLPPCMNCQHID
jgi:hypothetical protein